MKTKKPKLPTINAYLALGLIGCGFVVLILSLLGNTGVYLRAMFVRTRAPETFAFETYTELLKKYVHLGGVDYAELKKGKELELALAELESTAPDNLSEEEQGCYWLNADQLLKMKLICDRYPNIQNVNELGNEPGTRNFVVGGKIMTVKQIDEEDVQPYIQNNWEILFSRCSGALGGPNIMDHPYTVATIKEDLAQNVRKFVRRSDNWSYDDDNNRLHLSQWYQWNHVLLDEYFNPVTALNQVLPEERQIPATKLVFCDIPFDYRINDYGLVKNHDLEKRATKVQPDSSKVEPTKSATDGATATSTAAVNDESAGSAEQSDPSVPKPPPAKILIPTEVPIPGPGITIPGAEKGK